MQERLAHPLFIGVCVGVFGALGASSRALLTDVFSLYSVFPYGTWALNTIGSFLLSILFFHPTIRKNMHPTLFTACTVGAIGSFTTFSTVTIETVELLLSQQLIGLFYVTGNLLTSIGACFLAYLLMKERA